MMAKRELDLVPRVEAVRDERKIQPPVHFSLAEILQHYSESYAAIRNQFVVADQMLQEGNEEACKMIWRSQVVLAEGLLDFYIHELSKFCMFQMFAGQWNKSDKYNQFMVPMAKVEEKDLKLNLSEHAFIQPMLLLRDHDVFLLELHIQLDAYPQMEVYS